ncbi:MAG: MOSC domain-containing protein, partial [Euzebya sp.]
SNPRVPRGAFQHEVEGCWGGLTRPTQVGRPGSYLRVITGGDVAAGDTVTLLSRPAHGVSIGRWFTTNDPDDARALLAAESDEWHMGQALRRHVDRVVARSTTGR